MQTSGTQIHLFIGTRSKIASQSLIDQALNAKNLLNWLIIATMRSKSYYKLEKLSNLHADDLQGVIERERMKKKKQNIILKCGSRKII